MVINRWRDGRAPAWARQKRLTWPVVVVVVVVVGVVGG
jgi:hypothetical protein